MHPIKNIIFDLGGIFLEIDFSRSEKAFSELGVADFNKYITQYHISELFELLETGKISQDAFCMAFRKETGIKAQDEAIVQAWNALLIGFPDERIKWLKQIGKKYNIFLFSNTNKIHYDSFTNTFYSQPGQKDLNSYFIKAYYSHEIGLRKPHPESFRYILREQNLVPEETLFIDDTLANIEGAKAVGLQTLYLEHPNTILDLML